VPAVGGNGAGGPAGTAGPGPAVTVG
jgi:hypothetical protein